MGICGLYDVFQPGLLGGQCVKICIRFGVGRIHGIQFFLGFPYLGHAVLDIPAYILAFIQLGFLGQIANLQVGLRPCFSDDFVINSGHDPKQGRFARAVIAQHANFSAGEKIQVNVLENLFVRRDDLAHTVHGEYVFSHYCAPLKNAVF